MGASLVGEHLILGAWIVPFENFDRRRTLLRVMVMCDHMKESATQEERPSQAGLTRVGLKLPMTVSDPIVMSWKWTESEPTMRSD